MCRAVWPTQSMNNIQMILGSSLFLFSVKTGCISKHVLQLVKDLTFFKLIKLGVLSVFFFFFFYLNLMFGGIPHLQLWLYNTHELGYCSSNGGPLIKA